MHSPTTLSYYNNRPLRILQVHTLYPTYVPYYYSLHPDIGERNFSKQVQNLYEHGLQEMYIVAPMLAKMGCETQLIYSNAHKAQKAWCVENGFALDVFEKPFWEQKVVAAQIESFKPDVLFFTDNHHFDGNFLEKLNFQPKLIVAWRHAPIQLLTNWNNYDIILSGSRRFVNLATHLGAKKSLQYTFGLPRMEDRYDCTKKRDLFFCGTYRSVFEPNCHAKRRKFLDIAAQVCIAEKASVDLFLSDVTTSLPKHLQNISHAPLYGSGMYSEIFQSRMGVDILGNATAKMHDTSILQLTAGDTVNMRLVEYVACNTLAFAEYRGRLSQLFEPMKEVVTYNSINDFEDKLRYFINNKDEAIAIAANGYARFKKDLNQHKTLSNLLSIFQQGLKDKESPEKTLQTTVIPHASVLQKMLTLLAKFPENAGQDAWELEENIFNIACALAVKGDYASAFELDTLINRTPFVQADMQGLLEE